MIVNCILSLESVSLVKVRCFPWHIVFCEGSSRSKKTEAVKNSPRPLCASDLESFLGLTRYYRRFMEKNSSIASPLTKLTKESEISMVRSL